MSGLIFLVNVEAPETRIAEMRDGRLFALNIDRGGYLLGDVFKGRVENVLPGMDAAFINLGLSRNALIYAGDIGAIDATNDKPLKPIENLVRVGDEMIVQIARPPVGSKGARVTTRLSLPGRFVVLATHSETVGVSRRMEDEDERARLRRIAERVRPLDHGIIVRTEAEGVNEHDLAHDIADLSQYLQRIHRLAAQSKAPCLLHKDLGTLGRMVRDRLQSNVEKIVVDDGAVFETLRESLQDTQSLIVPRLQLYQEATPLFKAYGVEKEIKRATERFVPLRRGGGLVIDETEALTAIDVNTGRFVGKGRLADTVLQTNLEAVEEVARQLRIRDLAGVIVIDFIDMERTRDRAKVLNALEDALRLDRAKTRIVQLSPSGLVEMTRRREGSSLRHLLHRPCPYCSGDGMIESPLTVAVGAKRQVREMARSQMVSSLQLTMHPETACAFVGEEDEMIRDLESETGTFIYLDVDFAYHLETTRLLSGEPHDLEAAGLHFRPGEQFEIAARVPLYPLQEPQFLVLSNKLTKIENLRSVQDEHGNAQLPAATRIEVTAVHRWYLSARLVV